MTRFPPVPDGLSREIAGFVLHYSARTIGNMLARGTLARTDDGHVSTASVGAARGSAVLPEEYAAALAWQRSRTNRWGTR